MTPNPAALAVLLDAARACYGDDSEQVRWLLNPDAVRALLRHAPTTERYDEQACPHCEAIHDDTARSIHSRTCPVAAAWRALGDPRGQADIERAHEEALRDRRQMSRTATHGEWGPGPAARLLPRQQSDARGMEAVEAEARLWCPSDEDDHRHNLYFRHGLYECMLCKQRSMPRYIQFRVTDGRAAMHGVDSP